MTSSAQLKVCSNNNCITNLIGYYIKGQGTRITDITGEGTSTLYNSWVYHIHGIIDESNIWWIVLKTKLASISIGGFEYCMEGNPCLQSK